MLTGVLLPELLYAMPEYLRSVFVPTRMMGVRGQKWRTSCVHLSDTLAKLSRLSIEKQMMMTSVLGYDRGRSCS